MAKEGEKIKNVLDRNVGEVIERAHLEQTLKTGKKLRVKLGIDPTSPDLHLGHAVVLRKLKEFQDLGHQAVLIIGDFTAQVGDPSGRNDARKPMRQDEIANNMKQYLAQAGKIIDVKKAEIHNNSEWFAKKGFSKFIELASSSTMQQVLKRNDFKKRLDAGQDITLLEVLYPVLQGYDSVEVKADIELGGEDQKLNLLMGRRVQRHFGMEEQDVLTVPLLVGLDGEKKMCKSIGNYIGLTETPDQMFGKTMSVPDALMRSYFLLATDMREDEIKKLEKELGPRDLKARLGFEIVKLYHGEKAASAARAEFDKVFSKKEAPEDAPELNLPKNLSVLDVVVASGAVKSKGEARRLIEQGAVDIGGSKKSDPKEVYKFKGGETVKIGKKHFFRITI